MTRVKGLRSLNQLMVTVIGELNQFIEEQEEVDRDTCLVSTSEAKVHHTTESQCRENVPDDTQKSGEPKCMGK